MGTNYYLHLGKASNLGPGKYEFIWAVPPELLDSVGAQVVVHTDGGKMTATEFKEILRKACDERTGTIGQAFS